jgi:7-cyano-7-deazaguanine synthase in queuosine biosynthesis
MKTKKFNKTILVCSSSGFDSTYLIFKNLEQNNRVVPLYVDTCIDGQQKKNEIQSLNLITRYFSYRYGYHLIDVWPKIVKMEVSYGDLIKLQLQQIIIYGAYIESQASEHHEYDEVQIGYILEDHSVSYLSELRKLWNCLNSFQILDSNKIPKLSFPLIKYNKSVMMDKIAYNCPEIFHAIHFCESPSESKRCEKCCSCKKADNWGYESYKNNAQSMLDSRGLKPFKRNDEKILFKSSRTKKAADFLNEIGITINDEKS